MAELQHYGVKGMHWGRRKVEEPTHAAYTSKMQDNDRREYGGRGVRRINKRLNEGMRRDKALDLEASRKIKQHLAIAGGFVAARILITYGSEILTGLDHLQGGIATRAANNRLKANWNAKSDRFGLPSKASTLNYTKPSRGVYNVTTMK